MNSGSILTSYIQLFNRISIKNMAVKQFLEAYRDKPKLAPLVRELLWTNNLVILFGAKPNEAKKKLAEMTKFAGGTND